MAKRTNIERIIKNEIEKGNIYIVEGGNLVSAEMVENNIKEDFIKALRAEEIPANESMETFKQKRLASMRKAEDLLVHINRFFTTPETADTAEKVGDA